MEAILKNYSANYLTHDCIKRYFLSTSNTHFKLIMCIHDLTEYRMF